MAETPQGCQEHQPDYKTQSWEAYSLFELGTWVHLFVKRAEHRSNPAKRKKDLHDAQNYLDMMQAKLRELRYENSDLMLEVKRLAPDAYKATQIYAFVVDDVLKDDELGYVIPTNNFDWYNGNVILPLEEFIASMRVYQSNLFITNLRLTVKEWAAVYKEDPTKLGLPEHGGHLKKDTTSRQAREAEARIRKLDAETAALRKDFTGGLHSGESNADCVSDLALANAEAQAHEHNVGKKRQTSIRMVNELANAERKALNKVANEKHKRNVTQQREAAGLDPRLPESNDFASCPKMTQSERED